MPLSSIFAAALLLLTTNGAASATSLSLPGAPTQDQALQEPAPRIALRIEGQNVSWEEAAAWVLRERGASSVSKFALGVAMDGLARARGVAVAEQRLVRDIETSLAQRIEQAFGGDRRAWLAEVERLGRTVDGIVAERFEEERVDLVARAIAAQEWIVSDERIRREWEFEYGPGGRTVVVRAIQLIPTPPVVEDGDTRADIEAKRRVEAEKSRAHAIVLRDRILGGVPFHEVAASESAHVASRTRGGLLDGFVRTKEWPREAVDALLALEAGAISQPLDARGSIWLFQVESVQTTPLQTVREQIAQRIRETGPGDAELRTLFDSVMGSLVWSYPGGEIEADPVKALRTGHMVVNGESVPLEHYARWLMRTSLETYVRELAAHRALAALATQHGIEITPETIERRVDRELDWTLAMETKGLKEKWLAGLQASNLTEEDWRREARRRSRQSLIAEAMIVRERKVTAAEIDALYAQRYGADGRRIDARMVVLDLGIESQNLEESDEQFAERVAAALEAAAPRIEAVRERFDEGEDFAAIAKRFSDDPATGRNGGRMPEGFDRSTFPEKTRAMLDDLPLGRLSAPAVVETRIYLFEIVDRSSVTRDEVAAALAAELQGRDPSSVEVASFINLLVRDLAIEVLPAAFR